MSQDLINQIFQLCIIPLLGVLTGFFVKWINAKSKEIQTNNDDAVGNKYIKMLTDTITTCVIATNQTYVEALKQQGKFDAEAQKEAFKRTTEAVLEVLSEDAKKYLTEVYGDLYRYIDEKVEATVNEAKAQK